MKNYFWIFLCALIACDSSESLSKGAVKYLEVDENSPFGMALDQYILEYNIDSKDGYFYCATIPQSGRLEISIEHACLPNWDYFPDRILTYQGCLIFMESGIVNMIDQKDLKKEFFDALDVLKINVCDSVKPRFDGGARWWLLLNNDRTYELVKPRMY